MAMRTARPLVTCAKIPLCGPSAIALLISIPRFIGPGCMMNTSFLQCTNRSCVQSNRCVNSERVGSGCSLCRSNCTRSMLITSICPTMSSSDDDTTFRAPVCSSSAGAKRRYYTRYISAPELREPPQVRSRYPKLLTAISPTDRHLSIPPFSTGKRSRIVFKDQAVPASDARCAIPIGIHHARFTVRAQHIRRSSHRCRSTMNIDAHRLDLCCYRSAVPPLLTLDPLLAVKSIVGGQTLRAG